MTYFKNKIVWITGASSGIGEALAHLANQHNAKVILSARNEEELRRVQASFSKPHVESLILPIDIEKTDSLAAAVQQVITRFGGIDILINNAGVAQRALAIDTSFVDEQKIIAVNILGTLALTKLCLPHLLKQPHGQIVVINSVMGKITTPYRSAYAAAKHALIGYFDCLRLELDKQIQITVILPGFVNTNVVKNAIGNMQLSTNRNQQGLSPAAFAEKALKAIAQQKNEVYIGGFGEGFALYLKRSSPALFNFLIKKQQVV